MSEIETKYSDRLKEDAIAEDNELRLLGIHKKILRAERQENFDDKWLSKIMSSPKVINSDLSNGKYKFWLIDGKIITFYPKANSLLIHKENVWVKPALKWLIKYLKIGK